MVPLYLREPVNAGTHGLGMLLASVATWALLKRLSEMRHRATHPTHKHYHLGKTASLLLFGACLVFCYGASALFHGVDLPPGPHNPFHRLDHVGIYLLIAGSYTPVAWSLMHGRWRIGTLVAVWGVAIVCAARVWLGGLLPIWASTIIYMTMGWAALACYRDLMRRHPQRVLCPLPVGGMFYSVGAVINLAGQPVLLPGVFAAHELFHCFVLAGSACHVYFMMAVVVPAQDPTARSISATSTSTSTDLSTSPSHARSSIPTPKFAARLRRRVG